MLVLLAILLGGLTNRIRGGLFGDRIRKVLPFYGSTLGRLVYATPYGLLTGVLVSWWLAIPVILAAWLGVVTGWGTFMDMGKNPDGHTDDKEPPITTILGLESPDWDFKERLVHNFLGITLRGGLVSLPMGLILWSPFMAAGLLMGPIYLVSSLVVKGDHVEVAEVIFGAYLLGLFCYLL